MIKVAFQTCPVIGDETAIAPAFAAARDINLTRESLFPTTPTGRS
jgi:hypothetical protein